MRNLEHFINTLNPAQQQAVRHTEGPLLVLAGAGTGKTRVLTTRLAYILETQKAQPHQILAVTFTNKAAQEMRERLTHMLGYNTDSMWMGTFHAISTRLLRRHAEDAGLMPNFTILDTDDQLRLIKRILEEKNISTEKNPPRSVLAAISRWKDQGLSPEAVDQQIKDAWVGLYATYQERLRALNALDFGDLLHESLKLLRDNSEIQNQYRQQFKYVLVDEYQDTNAVQFMWLKAITGVQTPNLCCVGDDDQSIYSWRGADVDNILKFEHYFPDATIVRLEQNYRSTSHILGAAAGLIAHNQARLGKTLWTTPASQEEKVKIFMAWNSQGETAFVANQIEGYQRRGKSLSNMAVLVRTTAQTRAFEENFMMQAIPYRVIGGLRFYERQEIRDTIAYLRLALYPHDNLAFERIINLPKRGIGTTTVQTLHEYGREHNVSLYTAAKVYLQHDMIKGPARRGLAEFLEHLDVWNNLVATHTPPDLTRVILEQSGYRAMWENDRSAESTGRLENLRELVNALSEFPSLVEFFEHVSLVMDHITAATADMVTIMTLHGAKGLEFDIVFLAGWEEGLLPNARALLDRNGLEEERRLAYVGLTRAKEAALISYARNRRLFNQNHSPQPSRFIAEIPEAHVEFLNQYHEPISISAPQRSWSDTPTSWGSPAKGRRGQTDWDQDIASPPSPDDMTQEQARVRHKLFGYGTIIGREGDKLTIQFDNGEQRKIMQHFIEKVVAF